MTANLTPAAVAATIETEVLAVLKAREAAEAIRAKVDAIRAKVLSVGRYIDEDTGERITVAADDWTMSTESFHDYTAIVLALGREQGLTAPEDCCPALVAESAVRAAEAALAAKALPIFGVKPTAHGASLPKFIDHMILLAALVAEAA